MTDKDAFFENVLRLSENRTPFFRPILMQFAAHHIGKIYRDFYLEGIAVNFNWEISDR